MSRVCINPRSISQQILDFSSLLVEGGPTVFNAEYFKKSDLKNGKWVDRKTMKTHNQSKAIKKLSIHLAFWFFLGVIGDQWKYLDCLEQEINCIGRHQLDGLLKVMMGPLWC